MNGIHCNFLWEEGFAIILICYSGIMNRLSGILLGLLGKYGSFIGAV